MLGYLHTDVEGKGKDYPTTCHEGTDGGEDVQLYSFLNLGAR